MPAPDVEARLSEEECEEIRERRLGDKSRTPYGVRGDIKRLLHELDAVRRERNENESFLETAAKALATTQGELAAAQKTIVDLRTELRHFGDGLEGEFYATLKEAERRGFAQCRELVANRLDEDGLPITAAEVRELQPEGTTSDVFAGMTPEEYATRTNLRGDAAPPVSEYERGQRVVSWCPQCGPEPKCDEDGCCLQCGATTGEVPDWRGEYERGRADGLEEALASVKLIQRVGDEESGWDSALDEADAAIRSLKGKPADWDPFTTHVEGDFNGPHGPAGGEGGA